MNILTSTVHALWSASRPRQHIGLFLSLAILLTCISALVQLGSSNAAGSGLIAFERGGNIFTIAATGGPETQITFSGCVTGGVDWSPDASRLAFGCGNDIWVVDATGSNLTQLTFTGDEEQNPSWSPLGDEIAYGRGPVGGPFDVWVINVSTLSALQRTTSPSWEFVPSWSPDGTRIAYTKNIGSSQSLWIMNADGTSQNQCLAGPGGSNPDWSPDGAKLAFGIGMGSGLDLYSSSAGCAGVTQLTSATGEDNLASWSPGGSEIAFTTNRNGSNEVWIMNQDGSGQHFLTSGGGAGVDWQPIPDPDGDGILPPADLCPQLYGPPPDGCPPPGPAVVGGIAGLVDGSPVPTQASPSGDGSGLPLAVAALGILGALALAGPALYLRRRIARN